MKKVKTFSIKIFCQPCKTLLYKYTKEGPGKLIKCFVDRINKDYTNEDLKCPSCKQHFAREGNIQGRKIYKMIRGKIFTKGNTGKK